MECTDAETLAENLFNKQFSYHKPVEKHWSLTLNHDAESTRNCELNHLQELKASLNDVKSSLNDYDIGKWSKHTSSTNPSAKILPYLRKTFHPELVTQAWCKFYELLSYGNVIPTNSENVICSVHLCEAPGGFICALNHYLKTLSSKGISHYWVGNTLNPYYEGNTLDSCIVDDRLISRTLRSWCFGRDNTGDIFEPEFISALQKQCSQTFHSCNVNLVTADGSLNCQNDPSEQETTVAPLHYMELLCALSVLSCGGNFVIKMFTLFEQHSINLMYALCCLFDEVSILKPATSKAGNSEVYVVSRGYCGLDKCQDFVNTLKKQAPFQSFIKQVTDDIPMFSNVPTSFISQHVAATKYFASCQTSTIKLNVYYYDNKSEDFLQSIQTTQEMVTQIFSDSCSLKKLPAKQCIVPSGILRSNVKSNLKLRPRLEGSYIQRTSNGEDTDMQVQIAREQHSWDITPEWLTRQVKPFWWNTTQAIFGKPIEDIHSSLFCSTDVIVYYENAYDLTERHAVHAESSDYDADTCILNAFLLQELSCLVCQLNDGIVEVTLINTDEFHSVWMRNMIRKSNGNISVEQVKLPYISKDHTIDKTKPEVVWCNFVKNQFSKWPELKIRSDLAALIFHAVKTLKEGGMSMLILPTMLTRMCVQMLWIYAQCFEESTLVPVKSLQTHTRPAIVFVGKKFNLIGGYVHSLDGVLKMVKSQKDTEVLELFPITALLHTEKAALFIESLRKVNDRCLHEYTAFLNEARLHS